jgi:hypothetical protein
MLHVKGLVSRRATLAAALMVAVALTGCAASGTLEEPAPSTPPDRWGQPDRPIPRRADSALAPLPPTRPSPPQTWALRLSGYSDVLNQFGDGDGQIALHGTFDPSDLRREVSNGCVRLDNEAITTLVEQLPSGHQSPSRHRRILDAQPTASWCLG